MSVSFRVFQFEKASDQDSQVWNEESFKVYYVRNASVETVVVVGYRRFMLEAIANALCGF